MEEKGRQVGLMGKIYSHAQKVITYAGPNVDEVEQQIGLQLVERLQEIFPEDHPVFKIMCTAGTLSEASAELRLRMGQFAELPADLRFTDPMNEQDQYVKQGWRWLMNIMLGEWPQRLWIVQEHFLNSEGEFLIGRDLLQWQPLMGLLFLVSNHVLPREPVDIFYLQRHESMLPTVNSLWTIWKQRAKGRGTGPSNVGGYLPLLVNVHNFFHLKCSDTRDKVYALISISSDVNQGGDGLTIRPDYSEAISPSTLSHRLSAAYIRAGKCIHVMIYASKWFKLSSLPSWSIDIEISGFTAPANPITNGHWTPHPEIESTSRPQLIHNDTALVCKGRIVDCIAQTSRVFRRQAIELTYLELLPSKLEFYHELLHVLGIGFDIHKMTIFCRSLTPHRRRRVTHPMLSDEQSLIADFYCFLCYPIDWLPRSLGVSPIEITGSETLLSRIQSTAVALSALFPPDYLHFVRSTPMQEYQSYNNWQVGEKILGRSFCWSEAGRFCNVMNQAQKGDAIVALSGMDRLFVIREVEPGRYRLIGDAYVDGLMRGEAYEGLDPKDVDYDIVIV
ncbi:hypothetical protein P171DRAFT_429816 [Karstenula rhodostoma CBS 690.94]|uniref:Heterokaryon incompatibility domain-containing protein n=1 Tax=Karstenula rhodostoma CBS 690.94 TaxID=1392251 RepID=A0A9P4PKP7_9PLEO|nr:hypothetical protein P171DRAFT_429816 [Karstenula rhodostoma CBS 690.94]